MRINIVLAILSVVERLRSRDFDAGKLVRTVQTGS
jgi:hypothetical protein